MNTIEQIIRRGSIELPGKTIPLHSNMDAAEGKLIQRVIEQVKPEVYLEVGLAYGVSALYAGHALKALGRPYRHYVLDPFQTDWDNAGLFVLAENGLDVTHISERSEIALPRLLADGTKLDAALIDGWHTFDQTLIDFYYINRMLRPGGVVIIDDTNMVGIDRVVRHIETYPAYRRFGVVPDRPKWRRLITATRYRDKYLLRPSAIALEKIAEDERPWDWHKPF